MLEAWTGEVKGRCHVAQIFMADLAGECGYSPSYLSEVINGRECTENVKARIFEALGRLEEKVRKAEAENENRSKPDPSGRG